jgi:predicted RNA-binding protein YlxR (DUF448 family)
MMAGKRGMKPKHIPQRTCVGCREVLPKRNLIRITRGVDGVAIDPSGKAQGRGAYLHDMRSCWAKALKGPLAAALRTTISDVDRRTLTAYMEGLAETEGESPEISALTAPAKVDPMN